MADRDKEVVIYKQGPERRVNVEACFERLHGKIETFRAETNGRLDGVSSHLKQLNTYNKKCRERNEKQQEEIDAVKLSFETCCAAHQEVAKTKEKSAAKTISVIALIVSAVALLTLVYKTFARGG